MDWHDVLSKMAGLTAPFVGRGEPGALGSGATQGGLVMQASLQARQALMKELGREATRLQLIAASEQLLRQHAELAAKPELTGAELVQLGVLSGTALALSAEALGQQLSEEDRFSHAVTQIGPWLGRAVDCGLLRAEGAGRDLLRKVDQQLGTPGSRA